MALRGGFAVVPSEGPPILFLVGALVTTAILLWTHQNAPNRQHGTVWQPASSYCSHVKDYPGCVWALLIFAGAFFGSSHLSKRSMAQIAGDLPLASSPSPPDCCSRWVPWSSTTITRSPWMNTRRTSRAACSRRAGYTARFPPRCWTGWSRPDFRITS